VSVYREYAYFYDRMMATLAPMAGHDVNRFSTRVQACIKRYMPQASSLLELGCGTGSVLAELPELPSLTGIDLSPGMLNIARSKVPAATFIEGDMAAFDLGRRFDVVICVFDTLNHLTTFDRWISLFDCVHAHLADDGIFVFDVATLEGLRRLNEMQPFVYDIGHDTLVVRIELTEDNIAVTDVRMFEHLAENRFVLRHERISELGVQLDRITDALAPRFELIEMTDKSDNSPRDDSSRAYFVYRQRRG
jgi:SAM-dependent methyltransferase